jgi:hypothetical protein
MTRLLLFFAILILSAACGSTAPDADGSAAMVDAGSSD